ncbi:hypothetical protein VLK31_02780 [Variovorax sp. H27-G14]|uniref:hypothetical protein n=1 Tax=Variovorax sp. H27-G14 TaxID=3111914 RepID=UPI0038FC4F52
MNTEFPQLKIERLESGLVRLEDSSSLGGYTLDVHPLQVRHIAEGLGLVREMSASDADTLAAMRRQHTDAVRVVLTLKRRILALGRRINHLGEWLCTQSDSEHADLSYEMDYATATAVICEEFCADLDDLVSVASNDVDVSPVLRAAVPVASPVCPAGQASGTGAALTSDNPAETQRVVGKASKKTSALAGDQREKLPV